MKSPIALARSAVKTLLSDPATGLNPALATACAQYGAPDIEIDFSDINQFVEAQISYGDIEESGDPQGATIALYGVNATVFPTGDGSKWLFSSQWCGSVQIVADCWIAVQRELISNFEQSADAFESAFLGTMNATRINLNGLLYDQEVSCLRQKPLMDGENWIIPMRFPMSFEVYL
jgi:hypothetical protein